MMTYSSLPALNASLNALAATFLCVGYVCIRRRKIHLHRAFMLAALACSVLFLSSYLAYHAHAGVNRFAGTGWSRPLYFAILWTHTPLAAFILPLIVVTIRRAWHEDYRRHRLIARWTLPLWMYVSVTGVLIYFMLYRWFVPA